MTIVVDVLFVTSHDQRDHLLGEIDHIAECDVPGGREGRGRGGASCSQGMGRWGCGMPCVGSGSGSGIVGGSAGVRYWATSSVEVIVSALAVIVCMRRLQMH